MKFLYLFLKCLKFDFISLIVVVFTLLVQPVFADGDNGSCAKVETIEEMNNVVTSSIHTENGAVYNAGNDYYKFTLDAAGILDVDIDIQSGEDQNDYTFYISNGSCDNWNVYNGTTASTKHVKHNINIQKNDTVYLRIHANGHRSKYSMITNFTKSSSTIPVENADDICYEDFSYSGTFCVDMGICRGGIGCTTFIPLKNNSDTTLSDVKIIYKEDGFAGSMLNNCSINPDGTCQSESNIDMGPFGFFGTATTFNFANSITAAQTDISVSTRPLIDMSCLSTDNIYATYIKNEQQYRGKISKCTPAPTFQNSLRDFAIRNPIETRNIKGNIRVIGNTVLCVKQNGSCYNYTGSASNASLDLKYIDTDSINSTFNNSSQAELDIPASAIIKWAAVYTQGYLKGKNATQSQAILQNPIYLTAPSINRFSSIPSVINIYPNSSNGYTYGTFSYVNELVGKTGSEINGWVTAADIKAYEGTDSSGLGNFGAWTLVVVYEDESETLKNISVFDGYKKVANAMGFKKVDITVDGFLTPTSGDIYSSLSIFTGEGDKNIGGDKLYVEGTAINSINAFNSSVTGFNKNPDYTNNQGIDIQNHDIGTSGFNIIQNSQQQSTITLTSTQDTYFPSMVAFTTELYEPRVCYKQEFFNENGNPIESVNIGDIITVNTWISNMKKDAADGNLETADKVEITMELDSDNLKYVSQTIKIKNIGETIYTDMTDNKDSDIAEYFTDTNSTKWRVGTDATGTDGGELLPNVIGTDDKKVFVTFQTKLLQAGDINISNIYKVSYENPLLGIRIGDESPLNIGVCRDINTSLGVGGALGKFSIVNNDFTTPYIVTDDSTHPQNSLYTQVVNKPFSVKILSLNDAKTDLLSYSGDLNISLIQTPDYSACGSDEVCKQAKCDSKVPISGITPVSVSFSGDTQKSVNLTYNKAFKNVSFKITYGEEKHACSLDSFAIRPDRFVLTTPLGSDAKLLTSGKNYNLSLVAAEYGNSNASSNYTIFSANTVLDINKTIYQSPTDNTIASLNGTLAFSTVPFNVLNGSALNIVGVNFTDVGKVNIKIVDKTWAQLDINSGDTVADCSATGAYICGDINATFIPDHFTLSGVTLHNNNNSNFTYISSDLNMSAHLSLTLTAKNFLNTTTQNFAQGSWENPVDINFSVPAVATMTLHKDEVDETLNLGFTSGSTTIPWNENNSSKKLMFNFLRDAKITKNPFNISGSSISVQATSTYISSTPTTKVVSGTNVASNSATFLYGRTHAGRQRYEVPTDAPYRANIYYEVYCFGTVGGNDCNKSLLPQGLNSKRVDDIRWFINESHTSNGGNAGIVTEKDNLLNVTGSATTGGNIQDFSNLIYNHISGTNSYPYKTTMENNASGWLIYNENNSTATKNQFQVEFDQQGIGWSGVHETNTTTKDSGSVKTNRRSAW